MAQGTVLNTGGAGVIGAHRADELLRHGYAVRALDNLSPQVHGPRATRPDYLDDDVELLVGDVRDAAAVREALADVDAVYHFAAAVGVGQSMYEIANYTSLNNLGTAVVLEAMVERARKRPFDRLVVASSMSIYGEGLYSAPDGSVSRAMERSRRPPGPTGTSSRRAVEASRIHARLARASNAMLMGSATPALIHR